MPEIIARKAHHFQRKRWFSIGNTLLFTILRRIEGGVVQLKLASAYFNPFFFEENTQVVSLETYETYDALGNFTRNVLIGLL